MNLCDNCGSDRILEVRSKSSDLNIIRYSKLSVEVDGYVPYDLGIGGGDYINLDILSVERFKVTFRSMTKLSKLLLRTKTMNTNNLICVVGMFLGIIPWGILTGSWVGIGVQAVGFVLLVVAIWRIYDGAAKLDDGGRLHEKV